MEKSAKTVWYKNDDMFHSWGVGELPSNGVQQDGEVGDVRRGLHANIPQPT